MDKVYASYQLPRIGLDRIALHADLIVWPHDHFMTLEEIVEHTSGCRVLVYFPIYPLTATLFDQRPEIELVALFSAGLDKVDLQAARERAVMVTNTPDVLTAATADLTMAHILAVSRRVVEGDRMVRTGNFKNVRPMYPLGFGLEGKTLGIYGLGNIGSAVARRASSFGLRIIYHNRKPRRDLETGIQAEYVRFEELLSKSDIISINAPLTDQTKDLFNYSTFQKMKPTAFLINTSRGGIVVEPDLTRALKEGLLQGAGLDVFAHEPEIHRELLDLDNIVLTPHIGSATLETRTKMSILVAENVLAFLDGKEPPHRVV